MFLEIQKAICSSATFTGTGLAVFAGKAPLVAKKKI